MKKACNTVDEKQLKLFVSRIKKDAKRLFRGKDGSSLIEINVRNRSSETSILALPVPSIHLIETDEEWLDAISTLSVNANSASERLNQFIKVWQSIKQDASNKETFVVELEKLFKKLKLSLCLSDPKSLEVKGKGWHPVVVNGMPLGFSGMCNYYSHYRKLGLDYVATAVEIARQTDPQVKHFHVTCSPQMFLRVYALMDDEKWMSSPMSNEKGKTK